MKFAYLKEPNPINSDVIAVSTELPPEFNLEKYIDRDRMFKQTFVDIIKSILDIVDWEDRTESNFILREKYEEKIRFKRKKIRKITCS